MNSRTNRTKDREAVNKLKSSVLRQINKRLRELERGFGIQYVAFRLTIPPARAQQLLSGEIDMKLETLSDLALAVGCRLEPTIKKRRK